MVSVVGHAHVPTAIIENNADCFNMTIVVDVLRHEWHTIDRNADDSRRVESAYVYA